MDGGDQVGRYRLVEPLGFGGMGAVWVGQHVEFEHRVAIKLLRSELAMRPDAIGRFANEARAATSISDPGIVQVFDAGQSDGIPYIVMELLEGEALDARIKRRGQLSVLEALQIARQVAGTLGAAHAANIIHRDVKPENIFLVRDPGVPTGERAKVLDFGIAKLGELSAVKTSTAVVMGTPLYMSPEQCRGAGEVDARSDVYALGCVLFTLVTGKPPFEGVGGGEVIGKHQFQPAPLASSRASVPPTFDALVARCLEKEPDDRFASCSELAAAIDAMLSRPSFSDWVDSLPSDLRMVAKMQSVVALSYPTTTTLGGAAMALSGVRKRGPWIAAVAAVIAIAIGVAVGFGSREGSVVTSEPPPAPRAVTIGRISDALDGFATWSAAHAGAACPGVSELGPLTDGWDHPMRVTCTEQPNDQRIGVISAGPDGAPGTVDDITSWALPETSLLVRGSHWE